MLDFKSEVKVLGELDYGTWIEYNAVVDRTRLTLDDIIDIGVRVDKEALKLAELNNTNQFLFRITYCGQDLLHYIFVDLKPDEEMVLKDLLVAFRLQEAEHGHHKFIADVKNLYGKLVAENFNFDELFQVLVAKKRLQAEIDFYDHKKKKALCQLNELN
jgi:hypothetical protein